MCSYQHPEEERSHAVPTVEITDFDYRDYEDTVLFETNHHAPSSSRRSSGKRGDRAQTHDSGSDTERDTSDMSSRASRNPSSGSSKRRLESSKSKSRTKPDDWTDVTEPEERRRIQNRIAQRKFREKAREQKEQSQRDMQNREHAVNAYRVPQADDLAGQDEEVPGLPWGGFSMQYIVARGHESASQQGSRHASDHHHHRSTASSEVLTAQYIADTYSESYGQTLGFDGRDSSGDDRLVYEESPFFYDYGTTTSPGSGMGYGQ